MVKKSSKSVTKTKKYKFYNVKRYNFIGLVGALVCYLLSMLPSLLPRPWWLQAVVSGASMAVGYGIGVLLSVAIRWLSQKELRAQKKDQAWKIVTYAIVPAILIMSWLGTRWQNEVRDLLGMERLSSSIIAIVLSAIGLFLLLLSIGRGIRRMARKLRAIARKKLPPHAGAVIGFGAATLVVYWIVSGLMLSNFLRVVNNAYGTRDNRAPDGITQPTEFEKSGSPESLVSWDKIGFQGRGFVGSGPSAEQIKSYTGRPAKEPIRAYAGLQTADSPEARAELALAELKRTKAFERKVLVIGTATGTGWLDPRAVDALEFMYDGDTAIVSQQYSYLPSWISFLVDKENARAAGRALYDTVIDEWSRLPKDTRPKLIVYGLSLGSFGGQAAFSGINDIRRSTDGALFTGTPNESEVWRKTTDNRDEGSPEWQPTYKSGETVRFASTKEQILADDKNWQPSRILFVQHANDPVVWFSFDLILHEPDWLKEPRGTGVSNKTRWYPFITFLQVGLDQAIAESAPVGHGHYYIDTTVYAWQAVVPPKDWSTQKSEALQNYLNDTFYNIPASSSL